MGQVDRVETARTERIEEPTDDDFKMGIRVEEIPHNRLRVHLGKTSTQADHL